MYTFVLNSAISEKKLMCFEVSYSVFPQKTLFFNTAWNRE